jgi:hypothetical protein
MNRRKLLGLVASGALVLGAMFASTGVVSADGSELWTGQGTTDGQLNDSECDASNTPFLLWVFTPGGGGNTITAVKLTLGGSGTGTFDFNLDNGQWKVQTDFFDLDTLTAVADYTGDPGNGNVNLVISHGCAGETTSSSSSSESSSSSVESSSSSVESSSSSVESSSSSVESSSSSVESSSSSVESSSSSESHSQTVSGESSSITEPNTATIGDGNSSNRGSSAWLLIAALGALFGSILVLTPSKAKNRE